MYRILGSKPARSFLSPLLIISDCIIPHLHYTVLCLFSWALVLFTETLVWNVFNFYPKIILYIFSFLAVSVHSTSSLLVPKSPRYRGEEDDDKTKYLFCYSVSLAIFVLGFMSISFLLFVSIPVSIVLIQSTINNTQPLEVKIRCVACTIISYWFHLMVALSVSMGFTPFSETALFLIQIMHVWICVTMTNHPSFDQYEVVNWISCVVGISYIGVLNSSSRIAVHVFFWTLAWVSFSAFIGLHRQVVFILFSVVITASPGVSALLFYLGAVFLSTHFSRIRYTAIIHPIHFQFEPIVRHSVVSLLFLACTRLIEKK